MLLEFSILPKLGCLYPNLQVCTQIFLPELGLTQNVWVFLPRPYVRLCVCFFFYFMLDLLQICGFKSRRLVFFFFQIRIILSSNHISTLKVSSHTLLVNHADFTRTCIRLSSFLQEFTHWRITRVLLFFRTVAVTAIPCPLLIRLSSVCPRRPV